MTERLSSKYLMQVWPRLAREASSVTEAAWRLGVKPKTLEKALARQGIRHADHGLPMKPARPRKHISRRASIHDIAPTRDLLVERFPEMLERGLTGVQMAEELGVSEQAFRTALYRARKFGELPPEPLPDRRITRRESILDEWEFLRDSDVSVEEAANRLGLRVDTFRSMLETARRRGDLRGARTLAEVWTMKKECAA